MANSRTLPSSTGKSTSSMTSPTCEASATGADAGGCQMLDERRGELLAALLGQPEARRVDDDVVERLGGALEPVAHVGHGPRRRHRVDHLVRDGGRHAREVTLHEGRPDRLAGGTEAARL